MAFDVHQAVTDRIIATLETGEAGAWSCPWHRTGGGVPRNASTGKAYRGINILSLWVGAQAAGYTDDRWATYRQWADIGAQVRKGERSTLVVFFKELPADALQDGEGPIGSMGLPLTAQRSIAVDTRSVPLGTPVWIVSTLPTPSSDSGKTPLPQALQHLVVAQDTGSAITGAVRADYFWGSGVDAQQWAGRTKQPLRMWVLWPRSSAPATNTAALP